MKHFFLSLALALALSLSLFVASVPASAHSLAHKHLFIAPNHITQTDEESRFNIHSLIAFGFYGRHLHPREKYTITADFDTGGACFAWVVGGGVPASTDGEFTVMTDRHGAFNTAIIVEDCLPQEYDVEATDPAGGHYEAEVWIVS